MGDIINVLLLLSVMCLLLGVGLSTPFGKVLAIATQYQLVLRGLVANFVIVPCVFTFALQGVPLGPDIVIGLLVLAAVPVAPLAPPFVGLGRGDVAYAVGLMLIVAFLSLPLTPLILAFSLPPSEAGLEIDTLKILQTLLTAQLIPLSVGMTIQRVRPRWAAKLLQFVPKLGRIGVVLSLTLITATQAQQIVRLGILPHLAALFSIFVCLLIGDGIMRGEAAEIRRSLAISTAIRNVALALLIVGTNFPGSSAITMVFVFGLLSLIVGFTYGKLMIGAEVQSARV
ncbi:MAG: bile acid:sodium symporter family protein [Candidatus Binatia bacterium]